MESIDNIITEVAEVAGVPKQVITGYRRTRYASYSRFLAAAAIRQRLPWLSLDDIACALRRGDHTTIIHSLKRFRELILTDRLFAKHAQTLNLN